VVNIYITGPSGGGKTSAGKIVAKLLNRPFVNHDDLFEQRFGSIMEYWKKHQDEGLARAMAEIVREVHEKDGQVIAPFAAAFAYAEAPRLPAENAQICKHNGFFVLLLPSRWDWRAIRILIHRNSYRPNYQVDRAWVERNYRQRTPVLKRLADVIIYDNTSPETAAQKIIDALKREHIA
jgi:shikimate kinase